jgi:hypothetical protein
MDTALERHGLKPQPGLSKEAPTPSRDQLHHEGTQLRIDRQELAKGRHRMKRITLLVTFAVLATVAWAHQDRILWIGPDGVILGLPSAYYETTRLHVAFSDGDKGALQQLTFMSSGREASVQPCLLRLIPKGSLDRIFLAGSWYHEESLLPHYVHVAFRSSPYQVGWPDNSNVSFLFGLRDASLLQVTQVARVIPLSNGCPHTRAQAAAQKAT